MSHACGSCRSASAPMRRPARDGDSIRSAVVPTDHENQDVGVDVVNN